VGLCNKGKRCKKSHNLADDDGQALPENEKVEHETIDLFTDQRDALFGK